MYIFIGFSYFIDSCFHRLHILEHRLSLSSCFAGLKLHHRNYIFRELLRQTLFRYFRFPNPLNHYKRPTCFSGEMSFSQRLAVISLIHKKRWKTFAKNYRPISLTNTDYKIIAFIFARRLQKLGQEQTAYIKGRYIGINARFIMDIFNYCENHKKEGVLLFWDFEKAFDSVEWTGTFY